MNKNLINIEKVDSDNLSIKFIVKRFQMDKYRGMQLFQHNRYDEDTMYKMLESIKQVFIEEKNEYIEIPKGDVDNGKNNGFLISDYPKYKKLVDTIKEKTMKGTANTLKKNFFPDWERSGIIQRFNKKTKFKLNDWILNTTINDWKSKELYKLHISSLLPNGFVEDVYYILKNIMSINFYEFLLFFTFIYSLNGIDIKINGINNIDKIQTLIISWRNLTRVQRASAIENLKKYMDPKLYKDKPKNKKKDWGNFNNESQQIFQFLKKSNLFSISVNSNGEQEITLNETKEINNNKRKFVRNKNIYNEYHLKNETELEKGFEMDHIVKFSLITTQEDVPYIDNYLNILYIDGKSHSIKTQQGSNHMILKYENESLILKDYRNVSNPINLKLNENIKIKLDNINNYLNHNKRLVAKYLFLNNSYKK